MTLLLTRSEVQGLLDERAVLAALREGTVEVLFPGLSDGIPAYTVKVHAKFASSDRAIRADAPARSGPNGTTRTTGRPSSISAAPGGPRRTSPGHCKTVLVATLERPPA